MALTFSNNRLFRGHTFVTVWPANPTISFRRDQSAVAMKVILFPFSDYYAFAKDAVGYGQIVPVLAGHQYLSRVTPMPLDQLFDGKSAGEPVMQDQSGSDFLYCTDCAVTPAVFGTNLSSVQIAVCDLKFETLPYDVVKDGLLPNDPTFSLPNEGVQWSRYITVQGGAEVQVLQMPRGNMYYSGTAQTHPYPGGFVVTKNAVKVTWHDVPKAAIASHQIPGMSGFSGTPFIDNLQGKVNADTWNGYAPGTLLFETWSYEPGKDPFGNRIYNVQFSLSYNPQKWNYVPRLTAGATWAWTLICSAANLTPPDNYANDTLAAADDGKRLYNVRTFGNLMLAPDP